MLVIDDLQFLTGKNMQAEFCHTLNALIDAGRQVVIAADRPPADLETLDEPRALAAGRRPCGRDGTARRGTALRDPEEPHQRRASHHPGFDVPETVVSYISKSITHNGRDLEGALNRLLALQQADRRSRSRWKWPSAR